MQPETRSCKVAVEENQCRRSLPVAFHNVRLYGTTGVVPFPIGRPSQSQKFGSRMRSKLARTAEGGYPHEGQKRGTRVSDPQKLCQVFTPAVASEQHDFRMKKAAGDTGADRQKIALAGEDFDFAGAR